MAPEDDLLRLVLAVHTITRVAAIQTRDDAPSAQWRTLKLLRENGPQRVGDLAAISRVSQPGMTRLVGQLVDVGLVRRIPDETDARVSVIEVTDAGSVALDGWLVQLGGALRAQFDGLDDDAWSALRAAAQIVESAAIAPVAR